MPKDTRTKTAGVAGGKKMSSSPWRGLPAKLRGIPGSDQLFTMWGNDSFRRAPPVLPPNLSVWDARDPSRPLPYSFQTPTPIAPPPITGVAFVTQARAARSKPKAKQKQTLPRLLPAFHPSSHSPSDNPSCSSTVASSVPEKSYLYTYPVPSSSNQHPGSAFPLSWPPPPPPPGYVKDEPMVVELPSPSYASSSEQGHGSEPDESSPEREELSVSKTDSSFVYLPIPALPCSPPLSPWSSPGRTSPLRLDESLSGEDLPQGLPSVARAHSEPLQTCGEEGWGVYEVCRRRRLPRMIFKKPVTSLPELDLSGTGTDLVLPALRSPCSAPDEQDSADEGRDFDASCQAERRPRYSPYHNVNASRGAQEEGESDLPPLRLLLDQLEIDEHRRAQSEAQSQPPPDAPLADKLHITLIPTGERASPASSRRGRRATKTADATTPVPTPSLSTVARLAPRRPGQVKLGAVPNSGVAIPCTSGGCTAAAAVHPQRGGLHAF
ncbi:hypothetical protein V8D89_001926 [Ganoderma adspersum]